jgi:hypothetical protein
MLTAIDQHNRREARQRRLDNKADQLMQPSGKLVCRTNKWTGSITPFVGHYSYKSY